MLIRSLPDSSWKDAEFQRQFQSRWGRESCIIWGRARRAEFGPYTHTLSIRAAWGGAEYCRVDGRTIGNGSPGPMTNRLRELFAQRTSEGVPIVPANG